MKLSPNEWHWLCIEYNAETSACQVTIDREIVAEDIPVYGGFKGFTLVQDGDEMRLCVDSTFDDFEQWKDESED